ncbi:hypothetical protein ACFL1B_05465 [Nanoarchaeota archaeon]
MKLLDGHADVTVEPEHEGTMHYALVKCRIQGIKESETVYSIIQGVDERNLQSEIEKVERAFGRELHVMGFYHNANNDFLGVLEKIKDGLDPNENLEATLKGIAPMTIQ